MQSASPFWLWDVVISLSWHLCTSSADIWASAFCNLYVEIIRKQLTQASVIVIALTSADTISVFANSLHLIRARTIVWVLPFTTLSPVWIGCRWWWGAVCRYRCGSWCPGNCWSWCDGGSRAGSWCPGSCWSLCDGGNRAANEASIPWTCSREMREMVLQNWEIVRKYDGYPVKRTFKHDTCNFLYNYINQFNQENGTI